jgi:predicted ABC-type sugar transport system permease subunit
VNSTARPSNRLSAIPVKIESEPSVIGVLIIAILDDGLNLMGVSEYTQMIVKGAVVIAAVLVSRELSAQSIVK